MKQIEAKDIRPALEAGKKVWAVGNGKRSPVVIPRPGLEPVTFWPGPTLSIKQAVDLGFTFEVEEAEEERVGIWRYWKCDCPSGSLRDPQQLFCPNCGCRRPNREPRERECPLEYCPMAPEERTRQPAREEPVYRVVGGPTRVVDINAPPPDKRTAKVWEGRTDVALLAVVVDDLGEGRSFAECGWPDKQKVWVCNYDPREADPPQYEEVACPGCDGTGYNQFGGGQDGITDECSDCGGTGKMYRLATEPQAPK